MGGSQASENIALTRYDGLAMLQCVSITTAHNIVRQCNASWGKFSMALLDALAHVVLEHWHTAALFLKFFTASQRAIPRIGLLVIAIAGGRLIRVPISVRRLVCPVSVSIVPAPIGAPMYPAINACNAPCSEGTTNLC